MKMKNLLIPAFIAVTAMASANELNLSNFLTNTSFRGDARVRYQAHSEKDKDNHDNLDARLRLNFATKINENVSFGYRMRIGETTLGQSGNGLTTQRLFMDYKTGDHNLRVGRMGTPLFILSNMFIDTTVDGIAYSTKIQDTQIRAGYLVLNSNKLEKEKEKEEDKSVNSTLADENTMLYVQGIHTMNIGENKLDLEASLYLEQNADMNKKAVKPVTNKDLTIFTLGAQYTMNLGEGQALEMARLRAQYVMSDADDNNMGYTAGVLFGSSCLRNKGSWQGEVEFKVAEANSFVARTAKNNEQIIKLGAQTYVAPNSVLEVTYEMIESVEGSTVDKNIVSAILKYSF